MQTGNQIANNTTLNFNVELLLIVLIVALIIVIIFLSVILVLKHKENKQLKEIIQKTEQNLIAQKYSNSNDISEADATKDDGV